MVNTDWKNPQRLFCWKISINEPFNFKLMHRFTMAFCYKKYKQGQSQSSKTVNFSYKRKSISFMKKGKSQLWKRMHLKKCESLLPMRKHRYYKRNLTTIKKMSQLQSWKRNYHNYNNEGLSLVWKEDHFYA